MCNISDCICSFCGRKHIPGSFYLFDLMDLNQTFLAYDTPDGANCMTTGNRKMSQREAAVEAVKNIGLNQKDEIKDEWFKGREKEREMFWCRFGILKEQ